jgi:hypothetical protein
MRLKSWTNENRKEDLSSKITGSHMNCNSFVFSLNYTMSDIFATLVRVCTFLPCLVTGRKEASKYILVKRVHFFIDDRVGREQTFMVMWMSKRMHLRVSAICIGYVCVCIVTKTRTEYVVEHVSVVEHDLRLVKQSICLLMRTRLLLNVKERRVRIGFHV